MSMTRERSELVFDVAGMDCGDCARSVERAVSRLPGIARAEVNFGSATLTVVQAERAEEPDIGRSVHRAVDRAGYTAIQRRDGQIARTAREPWGRNRKLVPAIVATVLWLTAFVLGQVTGREAVSISLYALAIAGGGAPIARAGLVSLRSLRFDMNVLMSISVIGAAVLGEWSEAGLVVVLLPAAGYETNANVANLHWYLIYALFWVFIAPARTRAEIVLGALITALAVLSDPLTLILAPLLVLRLLEDRSRPALIIPAVYAVTLVVQLALGFFSDPGVRNAGSSWLDLPGIFGLRVAGSFLVGDLFLDDFWKPIGAPFPAVSALLVLGFLVVLWLRSERRTKVLVLLALGLSFAYLAIPLMLRGTERYLQRETFNLNGSRYVLLPILFLFVAFLAVLDDRSRALREDTRRRLQVAFTAGFAALVLTNFNNFAVRTAGPRWDEGLAAARQQCATAGGQPAGAPPLPGPIPGRELPPGDVRIPIAPNIPQQPFAVTVDCSKL